MQDSWARVGIDAVVTEYGHLHVGAIWQHGDHNVGLSDRGRHGVRRTPPFADEIVYRGGIKVPTHHVVSRRDEVGGHGPSHDSETNEGNCRHYKFPFCLLYTSPSPRDGLLSRMPSSA